VGIGKFLDALEAVVALLALVFVKWHGLPETLPKKQVRFTCSDADLNLQDSNRELRSDN
jgi:hypothetical protein